MLCGGAGCDSKSVPSTIQLSSAIPEYWTIAQPAMSWVDDYYDWVSPKSKCCRIFNDGSFCNTTGKIFYQYLTIVKIIFQCQIVKRFAIHAFPVMQDPKAMILIGSYQCSLMTHHQWTARKAAPLLMVKRSIFLTQERLSYTVENTRPDNSYYTK